MSPDPNLNDDQRHLDLDNILSVAKASHAFVQKIIAPLIVAGILTIVGGSVTVWVQVHDMGIAAGTALSQQQKINENLVSRQNELGEKIAAIHERVFKMWLIGGYEDMSTKKQTKHEQN